MGFSPQATGPGGIPPVVINWIEGLVEQLIPLQGPPGPEGDPGPTGPAGATGAPGADGAEEKAASDKARKLLAALGVKPRELAEHFRRP